MSWRCRIWEIATYLAQQRVENTVGMNKGGTFQAERVTITMVGADHSSGILHGDTLLSGGEAAGYVVKFSNGLVVYHSGDTALFGDMALIGRRLHPDLAILPIGDHFTMGPEDAAEACRMLGVKAVIPCHYGTFPVLTGKLEVLQKAAKGIPGLEVIVMTPGQTVG